MESNYPEENNMNTNNISQFEAFDMIVSRYKMEMERPKVKGSLLFVFSKYDNYGYSRAFEQSLTSNKKAIKTGEPKLDMIVSVWNHIVSLYENGAMMEPINN